MKFHEKLMQLRKERGWSQEELAEQLDVTRQTVSKWELGATTPEMDKLVNISHLFSISIDELVDNTAFLPKDAMPKPSASAKPRKLHFEYKSRRHIGSLPLLHVNIGLRPRRAKGVFAIGNIAVGLFSLGFLSLGLVSLGILTAGLLAYGAIAAGCISFGGISAGLLAFGGIAVGVCSVGGLSCGVYAMGGCAIAARIAFGGFAEGHIAIGDVAEGVYPFLMENGVSYEDVEQIVLQEYPHTWNVILRILRAMLA